LIHPLASIQTDTIGKNVTVNEFAVIRPNVIIGNDVVIHPHVVVHSGVIIGDGVEIFPGALIGKEPKGAGAIARKPVFEPQTVIGSGSTIGPNAVIYYDVVIGRGTLVGDGASIREKTRIGAQCVIGRCVTVLYNACIGDRTKIMDNSNVTGNTQIGNDVFISIGVAMSNDNAFGKKGYEEKEIVGPRIDDGAAIGAGATLLPKTCIGKNAIIGAGSVVTKDVQAGTVVMGIPARFVRFNEEKG
jgi:acetyltransferase-like isoleucine patch superfamily enzyme